MPARGYEKFNATRRTAYLALLAEGRRPRQAARAVGLHPATINNYRKRHPAFEQEEVLAQMEANELVEEALFEAAASGNVPAAQFWLTNRDPENWRDKRSATIEHTGPGGQALSLEPPAIVRHILSSDHAVELALQLLDEVAEADPDSRTTYGEVIDASSRELGEGDTVSS